MPRAVESRETGILRWFQTAPLVVVELVLGMVKDVVRARRGASPAGRTAIRQAAAPKPPAPKPQPKPAKKQAGKKKKRAVPTAEEDSFSMPRAEA